MSHKPKFLLITTVPSSLNFFSGQIQILKKKFDVELISSPDILLDEICEKEMVKGYKVYMKREIAFLNDVLSLISLWKLFLKIKPTIIHGNTPKASFLSIFVGWLCKVPIKIYYVHGLRYQGTTGVKRHFLMLMERLTCIFASHIYAVSFGVKSTIAKDGITKKKVVVIGNGSVNGIDMGYFSQHNLSIPNLKKIYKLSSENFVFGFVGRIVKDKGINELVKAFLKINKLHPKTRLLLVGRFETQDPIDNNIIDEIKNNKNILNVGFQKDVRPFLKMMNVFVFPSYREGFGVSLMEAAAMNVPAITSNIIGCNEIIEDGFNGVLIPPKSVNDLFKAMENIFSNVKITNDMSKVCRGYVRGKYEQKKLWNRTLKSYHKLLIN